MEEHEKHDDNHHKKESITMSKTTLWKTIAGILGVLLIIVIFTGGFRSGSENNGAADSAGNDAQPRGSGDAGTVINMADLIDDDTVKGDPNAPVTIVEWSDFECPFCARFYRDTMGQIEKEYIDTGKVKIVFRDFPLSFHQQAQKAAEAAECSGEQGQFWEMHDKLFEEGVTGGVSSFKQYASELGLDTAKFDSCLDSGKMASEVAKDMQDGVAVGITGTPGFIINGQLVSGAQPFANFKQVIDAALAK